MRIKITLGYFGNDDIFVPMTKTSGTDVPFMGRGKLFLSMEAIQSGVADTVLCEIGSERKFVDIAEFFSMDSIRYYIRDGKLALSHGVTVNLAVPLG